MSIVMTAKADTSAFAYAVGKGSIFILRHMLVRVGNVSLMLCCYFPRVSPSFNLSADEHAVVPVCSRRQPDIQGGGHEHHSAGGKYSSGT